jgi:hypothetical protein
MELIKRIALTPEQQQSALAAAQRGLEYYILALEGCYRPIL